VVYVVIPTSVCSTIPCGVEEVVECWVVSLSCHCFSCERLLGAELLVKSTV